MQPRGDLQQRLWEMMATPRGSRTAKGGVWALRSKSSRCESLVGPPQVVRALGKPGKAKRASMARELAVPPTWFSGLCHPDPSVYTGC